MYNYYLPAESTSSRSEINNNITYSSKSHRHNFSELLNDDYYGGIERRSYATRDYYPSSYVSNKINPNFETPTVESYLIRNSDYYTENKYSNLPKTSYRKYDSDYMDDKVTFNSIITLI